MLRRAVKMSFLRCKRGEVAVAEGGKNKKLPATKKSFQD
jgi:hypothetical protein